jgi:hypothetical protein
LVTKFVTNLGLQLGKNNSVTKCAAEAAMTPYVLLACAWAAMLTCTVRAAAPVKVLLPLLPGATSHQFQLLRLREELVARGHEVMVRPLSLLR